MHDHDATLLLAEIIPAMDRADLLRYDPLSRGLAQVFWSIIFRVYTILAHYLRLETIWRTRCGTQSREML